MLYRTSKNKNIQQLKDLTDQSFTTCFINSLYRFEESFGFIWGHGHDNTELTLKEKENKEKWELIRKNILDIGNKQKRILKKAIDELDRYQYNVEFRRKDSD